jgi:hypothetical protein
MVSINRWRGRVGPRLGMQHGLAVGWFLLVGAVAVLLLPGPAGSAEAPGSLAEAQTVSLGDQSHCGIVAGAGVFGEQNGRTECTSVESGGDSQVTTGGFGDIGMQLQESPVESAITNVHNSNPGNNNSNNTIVGNNDLIFNEQIGISAHSGRVDEAAPAAVVEAPPVDVASNGPDVSALPVAAPVAPAVEPAQEPASQSVTAGDQSHCGIVAGAGVGGEQNGRTSCTSVESGGDSQVTTGGFGDIGMQFQESPVNAPITNVHNSNSGNNNSNNTIVGDNSVIINVQWGLSIHV